MGKRGPRPMPTHLRLLRGNPSKEPLNKNEPQPTIDPEIPDVPEFLTGYAADEWCRVSEELYRLKLLTSVDTHTLAAYCKPTCSGVRRSKPIRRWPSATRLPTA